jgi:hypothetical protein
MAVVPGEWLTPGEYKAWARIDPGDTADDAAITDAVNASMEGIEGWAVKAFTDDPAAVLPFTVYEAGLLLTNRLMARRNSPDGVVGVSDMGTATILANDADINRMLSRWTESVVA